MRLELSQDDLAPLVRAIVAETLGAIGPHGASRLAFPEVEAAELLGVPKHVLRDCRLRGEVAAKKVGKSYLYDRTELLRFVAANK